MKKNILFLLFYIQIQLINAQNVGAILGSNADIKTKCEQLKTLSISYSEKNIDSAIYFAKLADSLSRKTNDIKFISEILTYYSDVVGSLKKDVALNLAYENLELCKKSKDCKLIAKAYILIARTNYWRIGNVEKGFEYYELAMKEAEKCNDKETLLEIYSASENIYFNNEQYEKNKQILFKKERVDPNLKNDAWHNANFGDIYRNTKNLDSAEYFYFKAIKIAEEKKDTPSIIQLSFNYALIPLNRNDYRTAIQYCQKGLEMAQRINAKNFIIPGNSQLYSIYEQSGDLANAKKHLQTVIEQNEIRNCVECLIGNYRRMSELNSEQKNYKEAYTYLLKGIELFEIQNSAQTNSDIAKVEEENLKKQKQLEIDLVNQQKEAETKIKNISFVALGVSFLLICGIVFSLLKISRSKKIISLQKQETELQKHLVEEKQKEITDSINYASRIQNAKLPQKQEIYSAFPGCFVLFKPKDIVSGDFYFFHKEGKTPFIAAADCTGHGVPGAFMSMIGSEQLNDAVSKTKDTSEVLKQLNKGIKASLRQSESDESTRDGMDIALCSVDTQNRIVKYAGANRPVWIIRSGQTEVEEIKATKVAIGGLTNDDQHFETHEIKLQEDDTFYICTDGYADQFSGKDGKKLMTRRFKEILVGIQNMTMPEQEQYLDTFVEDWKAGTEQVDDILVIGIRV